MTYSIEISPVSVRMLPIVLKQMIRLIRTIKRAQLTKLLRQGGVLERGLTKTEATERIQELRKIGVEGRMVREEPVRPDPPNPVPGDDPEPGDNPVDNRDPVGGDELWRVHGHVRDASGKPVTGVLVRLFDRDLHSEEFLGEAVTGEKGDYLIQYLPEAFAKGESGGPDLVVRFYGKEGKEQSATVVDRELVSIGKDSILFHASPVEHLSWTLDEEERSDSLYETVSRTLTPLLGDRSVSEVDLDACRFLHHETGLDLSHIVFWADDARDSQESGLPSGILFGIGMQGVGVEEQPGGPARFTLPSVFRYPVGVLEEAFHSALKAKQIPAELDADRDEIRRRFGELHEMYGDRHPDVRADRLERMASVAGVSASKTKKIRKRVVDGEEGRPVTVRSLLAEGVINEKEAARMSVSLEVNRLTGWNSSLAEAALASRPAGKRVESLRDLARLSKSEWRDLIEGSPEGEGADPELLANGMTRELSQRFPTARLHQRVQERLSDGAGNERLKRIGKLLDARPDLELQEVNFFAREGDDGALNLSMIEESDRPELRKEAMAAHRVLHLATDPDQAEALLEAGYDTSARILSVRADQLAKETGLSVSEANRVYHRAESLALAARQLSTQMAVDHRRVRAEPRAMEGSPAQEVEWSRLDGYEELFGRQNFCSCKHCASIFGPLAYFTDLMRFTEKHVTNPWFGSGVPQSGETHHLRSRRPDLWELRLDCESATNLVPTLTIVNEVLIREVEAAEGLTWRERRTSAFQRLGQADSSFRLPFHQPLSELRVYLDKRGVSLQEWVHDLAPGSSRDVQEQLGLSPEEARQILESRLGVADLKRLFRLNRSEPLDQIPMTVLTGATGLKRSVLESVVKQKVVDPDGDLGIERRPIPGTSNRFEEELVGAKPAHLDRIHRFVRLMNATDWAPNLLSDLLVHEASALMDPGSDPADRKVALRRLSDIHRLAQRIGGDLDLLRELRGRIPVRPEEGSSESLFDRLFQPGMTASDPERWSPEESFVWQWDVERRSAASGDGEATYQRLLRATRLQEEAFQALISHLFVEESQHTGSVGIELNTDALSRLIQWARWMQTFEVSAVQAGRLLTLVRVESGSGDEDPWRDLDRALRLDAMLGKMKGSMSELMDRLYESDDEPSMLDSLLEMWSLSEASVAFVKENPGLFRMGASPLRSFPVLASLLHYAFRAGEERRNMLHMCLLANAEDPVLAASWLEGSESLAESLVAHLPFSTPEGSEAPLSRSLERLLFLERGASVARKLGVNGATLADLLSDSYEDLERARQRVLASFRSSFESEERFEQAMRTSRDRIREAQRDALVEWLLSRPENPYRSIREIYDDLLIDPQVAGCMDTSRVVQATQSVQLYLHRVMLGLEATGQQSEGGESMMPTAEMRQEWQWRKEYRVWEANRKVFVYPENFLDPDVRVDKSPLFQRAEQMLLQQEISPETVENVYREYLEDLQTLTSLTVTSGCYDEGRERFWFLGRGSGRSAPWYLRSAQYVGPAAGWKSILYDSKRPLDWSVWEEVELKIPSRSVSPFVWKDRLHLCWLEREERAQTVVVEGTPEPNGTEITQKLLVAWRKDSGGWSDPVEVELGTYHQSRYARMGEDDKRIPYANWRVYPEIIDSRLHVEYLEWDGFNTETKVVEVDLFSATVVKNRSLDSSPLWGRTYFQVFDYNDSRNHYKLFGFMNEYEGDRQIEFPGSVGNGNGPIAIHNRLPEPHIWLTDDIRRNIFPYTMGAVSGTYVHAIHGAPGASLLRIKDQVYFLEPNINLLFILPLPYWRVWPMTNRHAGEMGSRLMREGVQGFLTDREELVPEEFPLSRPNNVMLQLQESMRKGGTDRAYERELFLHLPRLIARQLSASGYYEEAQAWYHTLFDPTTDRDPPTRQEIEQGVSPAAHYWTDPELRDSPLYPESLPLQNEAAIAMYRKHPFEPHAIAGIRTRAYQKAIVMDYVTNLLDWADSLFARDTRESINEATLLYSLASQVLGPRPVVQGDCPSVEQAGQPVTYDDLEIEGEFDVALETLVLQSMESQRMMVTHGGTGEEGLREEWDAAAAASLSGNHRTVQMGAHRIEGGLQALSAKRIMERLSGELSASSILPHSGEAFCLPANDQMTAVWDRVEDRLYKIRNCMNLEGQTRSLALFAPPIDPAMMVRAAAAGLDLREMIGAGQERIPVYRFYALLDRARQATASVQGFGSSLLSALEKKDAEELRQLQATHSKDLLELNRELRERQIEMDRAGLEALEKGKEMAKSRRDHFGTLIENELSSFEKSHLASMTHAQLFEMMGNHIRTAASIGYAVPQVGSPFAMTYGGQQVGAMMTAIGGALGNMASLSRFSATMSSTRGSYHRREEGWKFQKKTAQEEMDQADIRIRAAEERITMAERQLRIHEESVKQSDELFEFYRSKFSNLGLYTWLASELSRLYHESFELALELARMAEQAYRYERGGTSVFIGADLWEGSKNGLLAGERLSVQLRQMEKAWMDRNERTMEIEQTLSLGQFDPLALANLRESGEAEFALPEVLFDVVYPGHFNRRIKSVRLTIPCLTGPYTNVNAKLTLMESHVRPVAEPDTDEASGLVLQPVAGRSSIATSSGQSDGGQFELSFRDERYLPFEGAGAVSRWKLNFPNEFRSFDYDTISDVLIHLSYTSDEDELYRNEIETSLGELLNAMAEGDGYPRLLSMSELHASRWQQMLRSEADDEGQISMEVPMSERYFPPFLRGRELEMTDVALLIRFDEPWASLLSAESSDLDPVFVSFGESGDGAVRASAELAPGGLEGLQTSNPSASAVIEGGELTLSAETRWSLSIERASLVALCEAVLELNGEDPSRFGSTGQMLSELVKDLAVHLRVRVSTQGG
ncbi:MAG: neuraminidase-like domain-containing protein [Balneolaceae bacterium]